MPKKTKGVVSSIPAGFAAVSTSGDFPATWEPKEGDILQGIVHGKRALDAQKAGRKKAKKGEQVIILSIADSDGVLSAVWESHALRDVCKQANIGDGIFLQYHGEKKFGKKRLKMYTAALKAKKGR